MQHWSAYTGYDLILGYECVVYSVLDETFTQAIKSQAESYVASNDETVIAALTPDTVQGG